jgi:hypothetical protein
VYIEGQVSIQQTKNSLHCLVGQSYEGDFELPPPDGFDKSCDGDEPEILTFSVTFPASSFLSELYDFRKHSSSP